MTCGKSPFPNGNRKKIFSTAKTGVKKLKSIPVF
jgi:hypothetical protein